jgi:hypothetical protein
MFLNAKIYSIKSLPWVSTLYDETVSLFPEDEKLLGNGHSYLYDNLSLEELVLVAKEDSEAMTDVLNRLIYTIHRWATTASRMNPNVEFSRIYDALTDILRHAVNIYDPNKGKFLHLYRKMCANLVFHKSIRASEEYKREVAIFGRRVEMDENFSGLSDSMPLQDDFRRRATAIDLKEFLETLPERKKSIFRLYLRNVPVGEIAKMKKEPYTTVYSIIQNLIRKFNRRG